MKKSPHPRDDREGFRLFFLRRWMVPLYNFAMGCSVTSPLFLANIDILDPFFGVTLIYHHILFC